MTEPTAELYRPEAVQHFRWRGAQGEVLRLSSSIVRRAYAVVIAVVIAGLLFVTFGSVRQYASGPFIIRIEGRTELAALNGGSVAEVNVHPGARVRKGDVLVRFHTEALEGELERLRHEYDDRARARLRDLNDDMSRTALVSLRPAIDLAERRLAEQSVIAPGDGTVSDVRIRPGQVIAAGGALMTLVTDAARARAVAMIPVHDRPLLHIGDPIRLELRGYRYAYSTVTIASVGDEAVGPAEVKRFLGPELADTIDVTGPVILVDALLPTPTFRAERQTLHFVDGMSGTADATVRKERIILMLIPALKSLFGSTS